MKYRVVQLNRLDWKDYVDHPNPIASALMSRMRIAAEDRPKVKVECLRMMLGLGLSKDGERLIGRFVDSYLRLSEDEQLRYNEVVQKELTPQERQAIMYEMTSWEEKGYARGQHTILLKLLNRRFVTLTPDMERQIQALSEEGLDELTDVLFDFKDKADLISWLDLHATEPVK